MNFMRTHKTLLVFAILVCTLSCSEDEPLIPKSRDIKFEITGNFKGTLSVTFVDASGDETNEWITSLPWAKNITYTSSAPSTTLSVGGSGGAVGQRLMIKVTAGESLISATHGVANISGTIVSSSPPYIF